MTDMTGSRNTPLGAALLAVSAIAAGSSLRAESVRITLVGIGDVYSFQDEDGRGGPARINAIVRAERAANPNTLYLFTGDMLSPSILSGFDGGQNMIDLTNIVPFDLAVPGNHEFDFGPGNFMAKMRASTYPWAAVNITDAAGQAPAGLGGVTVKDVGGVKVALVPVAQDTTPEVASPGELGFLPTVKSAIESAKTARKDGADLVVGIVQTDQENDREIIGSGAFDVVLSGDDHIYATSYDGRTAYVETGIDGRYVAPLDLAVEVGTDKDGKRTIGWAPSFRFIDTASVTPDPETQAKVDALKAQLDKELAVEIGMVEGPMDSRRNVVRGEESAVGNLIADAIREATGADVAIMNGGGIRADRTYDPGSRLTRGDIFTELPFGNKTVLTELPGRQILAALENGVSQVEKGSGRFPQVSGMTYAFDPTAPAGSRVSDVLVGGLPIDPDKVYRLATNDYVLGGGDGYAALAGGKVIIDSGNGNLVANDVIDYIARTGKATARVEGRIRKPGG